MQGVNSIVVPVLRGVGVLFLLIEVSPAKQKNAPGLENICTPVLLLLEDA